jgi:hypothetical protein
VFAASIIRAMSDLMMEAASTSETAVNFYQTTRRNSPEDRHLQDFKLVGKTEEDKKKRSIRKKRRWKGIKRKTTIQGEEKEEEKENEVEDGK